MGYGDQPILSSNIRTLIGSTSISYRCASMRTDINYHTISKPVVRAEITRDLEHKYNLHPAVKVRNRADKPGSSESKL